MNKHLGAALLFLSACASAQAASFDCLKASTGVEKLICNSPAVSELDTRLGTAYLEAKGRLTVEDVRRLDREQIRWLRNVRSRCADAECLEGVYEARINEIDPLADDMLTCEEMSHWPDLAFGGDVDLGTGSGSPIEVDYGCKDSLGERAFMKKLLDLAERIRGESSQRVCTGSIVYAHLRYYKLTLTVAGMSPRTLVRMPRSAKYADWKSFVEEDRSRTAVYFRQWSEQSQFNRAAYAEFAREFDKAAAQLVALYVNRFGLPAGEARATAKVALGTVVERAAGAVPESIMRQETALSALLRSGTASPEQVREASVDLESADLAWALRMALIHNQPVEVVATLEEALSREGIPSEEGGQEPLLSLALGHMPNLEYLLRRNHAVDTENDFGKTALFHAIGMNNHAAVELLLRYKADVHHTYKSASELRSQDDCIYTELRHTRRSTLMHAAQNSDVRMLKILLASGANRDARDDPGFNAYDYALMGGNKDNIRYLASLGMQAAAPIYSADPDPSVRELELLSTLKIEGQVGKLAVAPGRPDLLVASVTPSGGRGDVSTMGLYLISLARPAQPRIVGMLPGISVVDFAVSPDGKRIHYIELPWQGPQPGRKYGLGVVDSSDPARPSLMAQVEGDFMTMHVSPDGHTLYLQERTLQPAFSRGLLVYDTGGDVPVLKCSNPFAPTPAARVFAYGFASFPDESLLAIADRLGKIALFDVSDRCAPKMVMQASYDFNPSPIAGGAGRTLVTSGLARYRLADTMELQASYQAQPMGSFQVNSATGLIAASFGKDIVVIRTRPGGSYVLTDRFRGSFNFVGGLASTAAGYVYIGRSGGLDVGRVALQ